MAIDYTNFTISKAFKSLTNTSHYYEYNFKTISFIHNGPALLSSTTISRTFKSATNSGTFESATNFFCLKLPKSLRNAK